jgi:hypothetical protein
MVRIRFQRFHLQAIKKIFLNSKYLRSCSFLFCFKRGEDCADPIFPGVASRVSYGYDWIQRWVCALDGEDAPEWFQCTPNATYSPSPTAAPIAPTVSPAPTTAAVEAIVNIHL